MADNALFRKTALDTLASPERLDLLMPVTSPQGWIALLTIGAVLAIVVGWSVLGRIDERVNGQGRLIRNEGNRLEETAAPLQAAILVSDRDGPRIKKGMRVQLDLTPAVRREQYGVLLGTVNSVGQFAATAEEVQSVIADATQTEEILKGGSKFLVRVALVPAPNTPTGFAWSSSSGPHQPIAGGMTISSGAVIVESRRPLCRVLPIDTLCAS